MTDQGLRELVRKNFFQGDGRFFLKSRGKMLASFIQFSSLSKKKKPLVRADAHTHLKVAPASMKWHSSKQSVPDDDAASGHPPPLIHYHHLFLFVITYSPFFYFKAH